MWKNRRAAPRAPHGPALRWGRRRDLRRLGGIHSRLLLRPVVALELILLERILALAGLRRHEDLCVARAREERQRAEDMGDYYRVRADARDLNYSQYFVEGEQEIAKLEDYHSHNTKRLDVEGMCKVLLELEVIQRALKGETIVE